MVLFKAQAPLPPAPTFDLFEATEVVFRGLEGGFRGPFWGLGCSRGLFLGSWSTLGAPFSPNKLPASISIDSGSHLGSILRGFGDLGGVSWELLGGFLVVLGRFLIEKAGNMRIHKNLRNLRFLASFQRS